jgi:hypothetical protein
VEVAQRNLDCVRFVVGSDGEHHRALTGIITEARFLRDDGRLSDEELNRLEETYDWFNDHVPTHRFPPGYGRATWSAGSEGTLLRQSPECGTW